MSRQRCADCGQVPHYGLYRASRWHNSTSRMLCLACVDRQVWPCRLCGHEHVESKCYHGGLGDRFGDEVTRAVARLRRERNAAMRDPARRDAYMARYHCRSLEVTS